MQDSFALDSIRPTAAQRDPVRAGGFARPMLYYHAFDGMESLIASYHSIFDRMPKDNYERTCQCPDTETEDARTCVRPAALS